VQRVYEGRRLSGLRGRGELPCLGLVGWELYLESTERSDGRIRALHLHRIFGFLLCILERLSDLAKAMEERMIHGKNTGTILKTRPIR